MPAALSSGSCSRSFEMTRFLSTQGLWHDFQVNSIRPCNVLFDITAHSFSQTLCCLPHIRKSDEFSFGEDTTIYCYQSHMKVFRTSLLLAFSLLPFAAGAQTKP